MKTVFYNAKVYVEKGVYAQAVLIEDGIIRAVGTDEEVMAAANAGGGERADCRDFAGDSAVADEVVDCEGRTVIPGLNDSHIHLMQVGEGLQRAPIAQARSIDQLIEICRDFMAAYPDRTVGGLHSMGWNQDLFEDEKRIPDRHDLDRISTEIPVILERVCGHVLSANTKAIELLGLDASSPEIAGGEIRREADGYPNGIFTENAANLAKSIIPDPTPQQRRGYMLEGMKYAVAHGLTSVQSNDVGCSTYDVDGTFAMMRDIYDKGEGLLRYHHQVCFGKPEEFEEYLTKGEFARCGGQYPEDSWLSLGPLKLFKDGSLGGRTALMTNGYMGMPQVKGVDCMTAEDTAEFCRLAVEHGVQIVTHCIGDEAMRQTIAAYETAFVNGENKLRHSLVHCQITDQEILDSIVEKDILVQAQPIFIDYDMKVLETLCGPELAATSYNFGSLLRRGVHLSYGTDSPVEDCNPFPNLYMAVTRKGADGKPEGGFYPKECVDVETAIDAYTYGSAYNEFKEEVKGRIKPGFYADLVVLDRDIFTCDPMEIKDILPVMTMVGGKVVYKR